MPVIINEHQGAVEVVLNWPEVHNSLRPDDAETLRVALVQQTMRRDINAVVISGTGKSFCSGANLPSIVELVKGGRETVEKTIYAAYQGLFRAIAASPVPVISAVDGAAIGLGADLAFATDVTFAGSKGWISQGWMAAGLIPATGGTLYVARRGGPQAVWRFLTAGKCDAAAAEKLGLVIAVPDGRTAALEMAGKLAAMPGDRVRATRELSRIGSLEDHWRIALQHQVEFLLDPQFPVRAAKLLSRSSS